MEKRERRVKNAERNTRREIGIGRTGGRDPAIGIWTSAMPTRGQ